MANNQHTPGPWKIAARDQYGIFIAPFGMNTTLICARKGGLDLPNEEIEANARLIAAAPELLDALKEAIEIAREACDRDGVDSTLARKWEKLLLSITC